MPVSKAKSSVQDFLPDRSARRFRLVAFVSTLSIAAVAVPLGDAPAQTTPEPAPRAVKVLAPEALPDRLQRELYGRVVAKETVELSFRVGGELIRFPTTEGERVARGRMLAALDTAPLERAVRRAELLLDQARRVRVRAERLAASSATSRVAAEDAETAEGLAEVGLADARAALDDAVLEAPFDGLVVERLAPSFSNIAPGQPIVRVHDLSETRVRVELPERLVERYADPREIDFRISAGPRLHDVPARIAEYRADTGPVGQSYAVELVLPVSGDAAPLPGASARVSVEIPLTREGRRVPPSAILLGPDRRTRVMRFEPDARNPDLGTVRLQDVTLETADGTELVATNLSPDVEIVAAGVQMLVDGERVRRWEGLLLEASR